MFPLTRVPFGVHIFDPQPRGAFELSYLEWGKGGFVWFLGVLVAFH